MADANFVLSRGYDAAAAITKRRAVKLSAADTVTPVTAITDVAVGVARYDVTAADILRGKGASVDMIGIVEMEAAVALALGALVGLSANGRATTAAAGTRTIGMVVGSPSSTAGDVVTVLLNLPGLLGVGA